MQYILFEDESSLDLLPLTSTRPACDLRVGALTLREKWAAQLGSQPLTFCRSYLGAQPAADHQDSLFINGKFLSNRDYLRLLSESCHPQDVLLSPTGEVLAFRTTLGQVPAPIKAGGIVHASHFEEGPFRIHKVTESLPAAIRFPWDIFRLN